MGIDKDDLVLNIKDDGKGFDAGKISDDALGREKLGLMSMQRRTNSLGGYFFINSKSGEGTRIAINIPLAQEALMQG